MASDKEYVVKLTVDSGGAVAGIEGVDDALQDTIKTSTSLKSQLAALKKELAGLDEGSAKYVELSRRAGELKDKIDDSAASIRANAGPAFSQLGNNARLLKDRFLELDFEGVGSSFKGIAASVKNVKLSDLTDQLKGAIGGFAQLGKALLANPIFLIGAAVAAIIVNFKEIKTLIDGVSSEQEEFAKAAAKSADAAIAQYQAISDTENVLRLQGKTEKEILAIKLQGIDVAIEEQAIRLNAAKTNLENQIKAEERNKRALKDVLSVITLPIQLLLSQIDKIGELFGKNFGLREGFNETIAGFFFDPQQVAEEGAAAIKEQEKQLQQLENQRAGFILQQRAQGKSLAAERKKQREDELEEERKAAEALLKANDALFEEILKDFEEREKAKAQAAYKANQDRIAQEDEQFALQQELNQTAEEKEIADLVAAYDKKFEIAAGNADLERELTIQQNEDIQAINKKYDDAEIQRQRQLNAVKVSLAADVLGSLASLNDSFNAKSKQQARKQFEVNKAISIVQTLISTYQSAQQAYASQLTIPSPDAPVRAAVAAGAAILSGLAQVNKIRQTKFDGGDAGAGGGGAPAVSSGGGGGGGATGPPAFDPVNTEFFGNRPPQMTPAYVLAGNVTSAQEAREKVEAGARL